MNPADTLALPEDQSAEDDAALLLPQEPEPGVGPDPAALDIQPQPLAPSDPSGQDAPPPADLLPDQPQLEPGRQTGLPMLPQDDNPDTWDVIGAGWTAETIRTDAWSFSEKKRRALAQTMFDMLPSDAQERIRTKRLDHANAWNSFEQYVLDEAARDVPSDPVKWGDLPMSIEQFNERIDKERLDELDAAQAVLDRPGGGIAEFVGAGARAMTDESSLALLPFGVSGKAARVITFEALLGGAGEALIIPRERRVARELGLPEPDAASRIITGAVLGGGIAGGIIGAVTGPARISRYFETRREALAAAKPKDADDLDFEMQVTEAEAQLHGDQTVQEAIAPRADPAATGAEPGTLGAVLANTQTTDFNEAATLRAIIGVESGGRADAQAATSSARGLGQIISSTWMSLVERHRPDLMQGRTPNEVLALRDDAALNVEMTRNYMRDNRAVLRGAGLADGPSETYLAHFMGPGGAVKALRADLETPIAALMSPREIAANKGIRFNGKSFADFTAFDLRMWSRQKMRGAVDPNASTALPDFSTTSRGFTRSGQIAAGDDFRIDVDYEVVDLGSLFRASGDFQPRDRTTAASDAWIAAKAAALDPAQLMPSPNAALGTPIVGPDNMIDSGNGRFGIVERAFQLHPDRAAAYRAQIEAAGFAIPEGVDRPILIARRKTEFTDEQRIKFAIAAQDSGVSVMTPVELARATGREMTGPLLARLDPAQPLTSEANADFVRALIDRLSASARGAMVEGPQKRLSANGARLLREAIFARAWPDPDILARFTEGNPGELKSLIDALEKSAPDWAALRAEIETGAVRAEMDISGFVLDAVRMIGNAREIAAAEKARRRAAGSKASFSLGDALEEMLTEVDMVEGAISPLTAALVRKLWVNGRPAKTDDIAQFLTRYAEDARKAGAAGGMFDAPGPREVLTAIDKKTFGDLPEDIGQARGFAQVGDGAAKEPIPALPDQGFEAGAASPEAQAADAQIVADLRGPATLVRLQDAFSADPALQAAFDRQARIPLTTDLDGYGSDAFWQQREYRDAAGTAVVGKAAATNYMVEVSRKLAWVEDGFSPEPLRAERRATILIGAPASGKSTIANPLARARGAAIVDVDEAKKIIPEYGAGEGANAVHAESVEITDEALTAFLDAGENIVLPKVGGKAARIEETVIFLQEEGYHVELIEVATAANEAIARMLARFRATGRMIPPEIMAEGIDGAPRTYQTLKAKGVANAYARIDNTPGFGQPRGILEDEEGLLHAVAGRTRRDRDAVTGQAEGVASQPTPVRGQDPAQVATTPSPETLPAQPPDLTGEVALLRAEFGDIEIDMPDGTTATARELLDDLDTDAGFDAFIQACAIIPNGATQ